VSTYPLLRRIRRIHIYIGGPVPEEIGHVNAEGARWVRVGEDVGALDGLRVEAEDVVDEEYP
jgi:hypothetical protein